MMDVAKGVVTAGFHCNRADFAIPQTNCGIPQINCVRLCTICVMVPAKILPEKLLLCCRPECKSGNEKGTVH